MTRVRASVSIPALIGLVLLALGTSRAQVAHPAPPPLTSPTDSALRAAIAPHATDLASVESAAAAGVWVIADSAGVIKESGILRPFPRAVSSEDIQSAVPALRGRKVRAFFMSRPVTWTPTRSVQVLWVTLL